MKKVILGIAISLMVVLAMSGVVAAEDPKTTDAKYTMAQSCVLTIPTGPVVIAGSEAGAEGKEVKVTDAVIKSGENVTVQLETLMFGSDNYRVGAPFNDANPQLSDAKSFIPYTIKKGTAATTQVESREIVGPSASAVDILTVAASTTGEKATGNTFLFFNIGATTGASLAGDHKDRLTFTVVYSSPDA